MLFVCSFSLKRKTGIKFNLPVSASGENVGVGGGQEAERPFSLLSHLFSVPIFLLNKNTSQVVF